MSLLDHYLRAVRIYLPSTPEKDDILTELGEHLRAKLDERAAELRRPLSEPEQEAVLAEHGNPSVVAGRYGAGNRGFSFGVQIIGPEIFPLYFRILLGQFVIIMVVVTAVDFYIQHRLGSLARYLVPMAIQTVIMTTIFACIERFQRPASRGADRRTAWSFPPPYLQEVPRWQSKAGAVCHGLFSAWWIALPFAPALVFGANADRLRFGSAWTTFFWPLLLLSLIGLAQRLATLAHPEWNWLQSATRVVINSGAVVLLYPILQAYPYVLPVNAADAGAAALAHGLSNFIWWSLFTGAGLYWLVAAGFEAYLLTQHLAYARRRRREPVSRYPHGLKLS
jgi:hypothetical protein